MKLPLGHFIHHHQDIYQERRYFVELIFGCGLHQEEEEDDDENVTKLHPGNGLPFFTEKAPMGAFSVKNGTGCNFVTFSVARCRLSLKVKT
jgi:hypothetical protein